MFQLGGKELDLEEKELGTHFDTVTATPTVHFPRQLVPEGHKKSLQNHWNTYNKQFVSIE